MQLFQDFKATALKKRIASAEQLVRKTSNHTTKQKQKKIGRKKAKRG